MSTVKQWGFTSVDMNSGDFLNVHVHREPPKWWGFTSKRWGLILLMSTLKNKYLAKINFDTTHSYRLTTTPLALKAYRLQYDSRGSKQSTLV